MKQDNHKERQSDRLPDQQLLDDEALSALMDGELSDFELRRLLARIEQNPQLLARWERFNLARAVLQPEPLRRPLAQAGQSFSDRIMLSLADQPAVVPMQLGSQRWLAPMGKFAVAASVAVAVFAGLQLGLQDTLVSPVDVQLAEVQYRTPADATVAPSERQVAFDAEAQQRLNEYIRSVSIPAPTEVQSGPLSVLGESPLLRPVSGRELISVTLPEASADAEPQAAIPQNVEFD